MDTEARSRARRTQRISGPAELVQAIPYLLGFHPERSLVLVGLHDGQLVVTARLDIPDALDGAVEHTLAAMGRGGTTSVIGAVYDARARPDGAGPRRLVGLLSDGADAVGCTVPDVLLVGGERWWSLSCDAAGCCPPEGRELPDAPSPFAAAAAYDGVVALPDRAALAALLDPVPDPQRAVLAAAVETAEHAAVQAAVDGHARRWELSVKRAVFAAARASDRPGWSRGADPGVPRFGAALRRTGIRDAVWMAIDDGRLDGRPLWRDLARRLPGPYDAAPLFLFGWASWRAGDGALANIAAERAVASDPGYSAAGLLLATLEHGIDPRRMPRLRLPRSA
jgi:hypothetical protein